MDTIRKLLARLSEASDEQLLEIEAALVERVSEARDDESVPLEEIRAAVDAVAKVRLEASRRIEAATQAREQREALAARVMPPADEEPAPEPEAAEPEALAASIRAIRVPADRRPRVSVNEPGALVAAAGVPDHPEGERLGLRELAEAFAERWQVERQTRHGPGRFSIARARLQYPQERQLGTDPYENARKIAAAIDPAAIVAAGGICAPVAPRYELLAYGTDDRPVRDALVRFEASRGGVSVIRPPLLTTVDDGTTVHTVADDEAEATKNIVTVDCPTPTETQVDAIVARMRYGNFRGRFFPEQIASWLQVLGVAHARLGEQNLLDAIQAGSTAVTDGQNVGAARDLLNTAGRLASQMRSRHRLPDALRIRALLPAWVRSMMREDLARQQAGDNAMAVSDAQVDALWFARGIAPAWYLDSSTSAGMVQGPQGAGASLPWEGTVEYFLFPEGSWLFLDGGELNLGSEIHDSTLNATNDAEAFFETFEQAAFVGVESLAVTQTVCVDGSAQIAIDDSCPTPAS